jgi:undecaprenyl-diphosphatase
MKAKPKAKTDTTPYKGHTAIYLIGLVLALIIFVFATLLAAKGTTAGWEYTWFTTINNWPERWYHPMLIITALGSVWMAAASVVVVYFAHFYRLTWRLAFAIGGAAVSVALFKHFVGRVRPQGLFEGIHVRVVETGMGFPSWHATSITIIMLTLLPYMPWRWRWLVPVLIAAVAVSRLYLGVHLPLDVIAGMALGTIIVAAMRILPQPLRVLLRID